ncbi:MAG: 3-oxoacyl-ACP synthase III family protein [Nitritalea sp.]
MQIKTIISGSGHYLPENIIKNEDFFQHAFMDESGKKLEKPAQEVAAKLEEITGIRERRYLSPGLNTSDMGYFAAARALQDAQLDPEKLDYIIFAHNFGDVSARYLQSDMVPALAARVKHKLGIKNPNCIAYDLPFGCPGWVQGVIQADYYLRSGDAEHVLVIGAETLSRVIDPHDRDAMIFSDGAGATLHSALKTDRAVGLLAHKTRTDTVTETALLYMAPSHNPSYPENRIFVKMNGRKLYEYAVTTVPGVVKEALDKAGITLNEVKKVLIHQANEKMDEAILKRLFRLYGMREIPEGLMPMSIQYFGNNSVATIPILYDRILHQQMEGQEISSGDVIVFASVGAGMHINAIVYRVP